LLSLLVLLCGTAPCRALTAPDVTGLTVTQGGSGCASIRIAWQASEGGFSRYEVQRMEAANVWNTINTFSNRNELEMTDYVSSSPGGITYTYRVIAYGYEAQGEEYHEVSVGGAAATSEALVDEPPAAVGLTATDDEPGAGVWCARVRLEWDEVTEESDLCDFASYKIRRREGDGAEQTINEFTDRSMTEMDDYGISPGPAPDGTTYTYSVVVVDRAGQESEAATAEVTLSDEVPAGVSLTAMDEAEGAGIWCSRVRLEWEAPSEPRDQCDFSFYLLTRRTDDGPEETLPPIYDQNMTEMDDYYVTPLPEGVTYTYSIVVVDRAGQDSQPGTAEVTLTDEAPDGVSLTASDDAPGAGLWCARVQLEWDGITNPNDQCDFAYYKIRREGGDNGAQEWQISDPNTTETDDYYITPGEAPDGTTYTYTITVVDRAGQESEVGSDTVTLTDNAPQDTSITATSNVAGAGLYCASVHLQWTAVAGENDQCDFAYYQITRRAGDGPAESLNPVSDAGMTEMEDYSVTPLPGPEGVTYTYTITVVDRAGQESAAGSTTVTLIDNKPAAVAWDTPTDVTLCQATLHWTPNTECDYDHYELVRTSEAIPGGEPGTETVSWSGNTQYESQYTDSGLAPGTTYHYVMRVYDRAGQWTDSAPLTVETLEPTTEVKLKLFKNKKDEDNNDVPDWSQEITDATKPVGGKMWVALAFKLSGARLTSESVEMRITENSDLHDEAHNHTDVTHYFNGVKWYKSANGINWNVVTDGEENPRQNPTAPWYLAAFAWQTTTTPNGHNELHTINLESELTFSSATGCGFTVEVDPETHPKTTNVQNLVITNVSTSNGTVDYFKWDPESDNTALKTPSITFTIEDLGDPHTYQWIVYFQATPEIHSTSSIDWTQGCYRLSKTGVGAGPVTVSLTDPSNGSDYLRANKHGWGPYTFDIRVLEYDGASPDDDAGSGALDHAQFKQPYSMWVPNQTPGTNTPGHSVWRTTRNYDVDPPKGYNQLRANYALQRTPMSDTTPAESVELIPMDPFLAEHGSVPGLPPLVSCTMATMKMAMAKRMGLLPTPLGMMTPPAIGA